MFVSSNYIFLFIFFIACCVLSIILVLLAYLVAPRTQIVEKLSAYECGFEPFTDARKSFDIHFYVVAILFIIFDLEIAFLVPWSITISTLGSESVITVFLFLMILIVGFVHEWKSGALDWKSVQ